VHERGYLVAFGAAFRIQAMIRSLVPRSILLRMRGFAFPLALAFIVFAITAIPYVLAYARTPPNRVFTGILIWSEDQDAYASFIRQAADGHWLFVNRLTGVEHAPAFFNLEWLLVGRATALLGGSTDWAYQLWRAAGAVSVACGFAALARTVLQSAFARRVALFLCLFGGGFQALCFAWNAVSGAIESAASAHLGMLSSDFQYFTMHPFAQILVNPHFSLPLGIFLLAIAAFVKGERTGERRWYAISGVLALAEGSMRPYEMIALFTLVPLFVAIESLIARRVDWARLRLRALPLAIALPMLAYTVWIFELHPVFKYWASQGYVVPISLADHAAHVGFAGVLFAIRLCLWRKFPFDGPIDRLMLAWLATVFFFVHSNDTPLLRFMPYTPQLMTSFMPPLILLGVVVLDPSRWSFAARRPVLAVALIAAVVVVSSLDSALRVRKLSYKPDARDPRYVPETVMRAYRWLDREAGEDDVVLCVNDTGHQLAKYASVRVVSGHWSVTPDSEKVEGAAQRFYRGALSPRAAAELLDHFRVRWIFLGPNERRWGRPRPEFVSGFVEHAIDADVSIYQREP
jgi:hypothetical protein